MISPIIIIKRPNDKPYGIIANYGKEYIEYKSKVPTRIPFIP